MPLYEYECESCGSRFERIQKFSDPPITVCPTCGGPVKKLFSSPAIQFKGSGFYINDYARSGSDKADKAEKSDKSDKSEKTDAGKSGAEKTAEKSESGTASAPTSSTSDTAKPADVKKSDAPAKPSSSD